MKFKFSFKIFLLTVVYGLTFELSVASVYAFFTSRSLNVSNNITTGFWITPSPTITVTPTITLIPTPTLTPTVSPTPTLTVTPTETPTPSITLTPTVTPTPTITETPTPTLTPTVTLTPTISPTVTSTPIPTITLTPSPTQPAPPGLIAYWNMEAGSGTNLTDISGNGNNLVLRPSENLPTWSEVVPPTSNTATKSIFFNGDNFARLLDAGDNSNFDFTTGFTVEAWIRADTNHPGPNTDPDAGIASKWAGGGWIMWINGGFLANYIDGSVAYSFSNALQDDKWHHVAITWNGNTQRVYLDAREGNVLTGVPPPSVRGEFLLASYGTGLTDRNFKGYMDEVKVYNYARTRDEIIQDSGIPGSVVINEFMPDPSNNQDWVELYNVSGSSINLSGWQLADTTGVFETLNTTFNSGGYLVVTKASRLNNGGDSIFLRNNNQILIDSRSYTGAEVIPDISIGRNPDGTGGWKSCTASSQGSSNNLGC